MIPRVIEMKRTINYKILLPAVILPLLVGVLAAFSVKDGFQLYGMLYKPLFSPPAVLFPIVWFILYVLMGVASYLVISQDASIQRKKRALKLYGLQLVLNFLWPVLFFGMEMFGLALLCALMLLIAVIVCYVLFAHISNTAGILLVPYIIWLLFAVYLNIGVLLLN